MKAPSFAIRPWRTLLIGFLTLAVLAFGACASVITDDTPASASGESYPIKVYFSKAPDSLNSNFDSVVAVDRVSPTIGVAAYSLQMLIAGPTAAERELGLFSELNSMFTGPSTCTSASVPVGGPDFTLALNKKGNVDETGTATVTFCRPISSGGVGTDARVKTQITKTLLQFSTITKVVILTKDGHCFADGSGADACLA